MNSGSTSLRRCAGLLGMLLVLVCGPAVLSFGESNPEHPPARSTALAGDWLVYTFKDRDGKEWELRISTSNALLSCASVLDSTNSLMVPVPLERRKKFFSDMQRAGILDLPNDGGGSGWPEQSFTGAIGGSSVNHWRFGGASARSRASESDRATHRTAVKLHGLIIKFWVAAMETHVERLRKALMVPLADLKTAADMAADRP